MPFVLFIPVLLHSLITRIGGRVLLLCVLFLWVFTASAQQKLEMEERVGEQQVPSAALAFIQVLGEAKVKWYRETSLKGISYEAKFKWKGRKHSVEFDSSGEIEDIEVRWKKKELDTAVLAVMTAALNDLYKQHRWLKIQKQYRGTAEELKKMYTEEGLAVGSPLWYEIELKAKKVGERPRLVEFTFDEEGKVIQSEIIILKNADHMEY